MAVSHTPPYATELPNYRQFHARGLLQLREVVVLLLLLLLLLLIVVVVVVLVLLLLLLIVVLLLHLVHLGI
jgi:hypothetical protein